MSDPETPGVLEDRPCPASGRLLGSTPILGARVRSAAVGRQPDQLRRLGYTEGPAGTWRHVHYLDDWPVVQAVGDRWSAGGRLYASALDAVAMALEPDDVRQAMVHAARGCCDE